ncbi:MAG TPA: glycosyltransferase family 2 protein [Candidatus Polarisedimenticolia bacterium]|nr:glycosyltransferase family 2 protein [Candidatus Polarisedimenticolia bacterium]
MIIPCLNEEATVGVCVSKAVRALAAMGASGEVIVVDNGSTDRSALIAEAAGARVVAEPRRGYGRAYLAGFAAARGRYLVIGDADDTYDFSDLAGFVLPLREGCDMVMGTRLKGRIEPGAMPWHHRWIGVPILSAVLNLLFRAGISDAHCGMRSLTAAAASSLKLRTTGMEFASEMIIKAARGGLRIVERPITLHRGGRPGRPHLRSFRDGWRHLKMMFMLSPTWLFLIPGAGLFLLGAAVMAVTALGPYRVAGVLVDYHWMIAGSLLAVVGFNVLNIGFFARIFALTEGFEEKDPLLESLFRWLNLERGLLAGALLTLAGAAINIRLLSDWIRMGYSFGDQVQRIRPALIALTLMVIGVQLVFSSFFYSILGTARKGAR